ncbi:MAG: Asparagine synthetase [glutamine-hydrolyzing] 3 [Phycisphaerae bacterium]|nr:Asparagine synthetase [glutamine-hydrolyzing] 3 [Phycisphaerae bacterium]
MCGIAGIIDLAGGVTGELVTRMRDTLTHRGPDDAGLWVAPDGSAGLGHRRLSILDLSPRGHQPMSDPGGQVHIVYNGEVYNFRGLRDELKGLGHAFSSDSDTEVILHAYLQWGIACIERLEGMFALAIHDSRGQGAGIGGRGSEGGGQGKAGATTYLVRDRLGIKPLFYSAAGGRLVFGSEIRAVLASGRVARDLEPSAAWDYFSYGYVPTPATIYRDVAKLPPGHVLTFSADGVAVRQYWQPAFEAAAADPATAADRLAELLDAAVADYLVADVPTGVYLSGGLDSSIVTQRAADVFRRPGPDRRLGGEKLHSFSIAFDIEEHSELHYARAAADAYGTVHHEQTVSREMAHREMDAIVDLFDEPFAASSSIGMLFVARLARTCSTVALCGEGGDETFGGYSWYTWWMRFQRPSFWKSAAGQFVRRTVEALTRRPRRKWLLPSLGSVELFGQLMGAMTAGDKRGVFSPELADAMAARDGLAYFRKFWRDDLPPMARMQFVDMMTFLPDLNLTRADRTSMSVSLELRVPLLSHRLVEYVAALPQAVRNPDGKLKGLFRQAVGDRLPELIRNRPKKGFSSPVKQWFTPADLSRLASDVMAEHPDLARQWLHPALPRYAACVEGSRAFKLWSLLLWLRRNG